MNLLRVLGVVGFLMTAGTVMAGNGGLGASGYWEGAGQAIYPDGTVAEITLVQVLLHQDGSFIYLHGASNIIPGLIGDNEPMMQEGQMSGHISGNAIKGLMGGCLAEAPNCIGIGVFDGKFSGNRLSGTVIDLSDGSTSVITLHRMDD